MMQAHSTDMLQGSIEGTIRQPGPARPKEADRKFHVELPPRDANARVDEPARETVSPMVLYGRLGYIRRDLTELDGAVHHNPPSEG